MSESIKKNTNSCKNSTTINKSLDINKTSIKTNYECNPYMIIPSTYFYRKNRIII